MIGQYRITVNLLEIAEDKVLHIGVKIEGKGNPAIIQYFNDEIFEAVFKAMKDANRHAFYEAISNVANEDV